jgi:hypothetical protein
MRADTERALAAHGPCSAIMGWPKAAGLDQRVRPWPRVLLLPWATMRTDGIVDFSFFLRIIQIVFKAGLSLNSSQICSHLRTE